MNTFDIENEKIMLRKLLEMAQNALSFYPTETNQSLTSDKLKYCYWEVRGEKRALKTLIEMIETALKLIEMESVAIAKNHYATLQEKSDYLDYLLLHFKW